MLCLNCELSLIFSPYSSSDSRRLHFESILLDLFSNRCSLKLSPLNLMSLLFCSFKEEDKVKSSSCEDNKNHFLCPASQLK